MMKLSSRDLCGKWDTWLLLFLLSPTKTKHTVCVIVVYYRMHIVFLSEIRGMPNSEDCSFYKKGTSPLEGKNEKGPSDDQFSHENIT